MRDTIWVPVVAVLGPLVGSAIGVLLPSRESLLRRLLAFAAGTMLTLLPGAPPGKPCRLLPARLCRRTGRRGLRRAGAAPPPARRPKRPLCPPPYRPPHGCRHYAAQPPGGYRHGRRRAKPHYAAHRRRHRHPRYPRGHLHRRTLPVRHPIAAAGPFWLSLPPACPPCWATGWGACCGGTSHPLPWAWSPPASPD